MVAKVFLSRPSVICPPHDPVFESAGILATLLFLGEPAGEQHHGMEVENEMVQATVLAPF